MRLLGILTAIWVLCAGSAAQDYLQYLPQNTIAVLSLDNAGVLGEKMQQHPIYQFVKHETVQKFIERPWQQFQTEVLTPHGIDATTCFDYFDIAQGQILLALLDITGKGDRPEDFPAVFIMDIGGQKERLEQLMETLNIQAEKISMIAIQEEFMGDTIVYWKKGDAKPGLEEHQLVLSQCCYSIKDNLFLFGFGDVGVKEVLSRMAQENTPAGLPDSEIYRNAFAPCRVEGSDYSFFINCARILEFARAQMDPDELPKFDQVVQLLGVDKLQALSASGNVNDNGRFIGKAFVLSPGERRGLLKLMQAETGSQLLPGAVPEDAASYFAISFSPAVIWEICIDALAVGPEEERQHILEQLAQLEEQLEFSFSKDFFPSMGHEMRMYKFYTLPLTDDSEQITMTLSLKDEEKFHGCLGKLLDLLAQQQLVFHKEDYLGADIYTPDQRMVGTAEPPALAIFNGQLIFSTKRSGVEKAVRLSAKGEGVLSSCESFKKMQSMVSGAKNMLYYEDSGAHIDYLKLRMEDAFKMMTKDAKFLEDSEEWIDWGLFPSAEVFAKYFSTLEIGSLTVHPQGFLFETYVKFP